MAPLLYPEYVDEMFGMQMDIAIQNMKAINEGGADEILDKI
jgi:hypothetical protein